MKVSLAKDRARPLDDLVFDTPLCSNCDVSVDTDGESWWCDGCGGTWERGGVGGMVENPCPARRAGGSEGVGRPLPCCRTAGHSGCHVDEFGSGAW